MGSVAAGGNVQPGSLFDDQSAFVFEEQAVAAARDALEEAETTLRQTEQDRLLIEQGLEPIRERINDSKLKEQEARLTEEQFAQQLFEAHANEADLEPHLEKGKRSSALQADITRLSNEIATLGAVNLAALDELETSEQRKAYLDSQSLDLNTALSTLEDAIHRIDRETRERLQHTFDVVNGHFGELFPSLFGGGQAKLVLSGEEILDAGVQVIAQPPGKKNSSIHLLSGGEKALTALSLVFAMFQLNPAPFCLLDEVDAPLDDSNTIRYCDMVKRMSRQTQFVFITHSKITMEMASQLVGVTMQESGVSRVVAVDIDEALRMRETLEAIQARDGLDAGAQLESIRELKLQIRALTDEMCVPFPPFGLLCICMLSLRAFPACLPLCYTHD